MRLTLNRNKLTKTATLGDLLIDGNFECHTLEDVVRTDNPATPENEGAKVWGQTAIPVGSYEVIVNVSARFKRLLPRLLDVPGFDGILIHKGNTSANTHGCILVGTTIAGDDLLTHSTEAFDRLFPLIHEAYDRGEKIMIEINNCFESDNV